ncbi:NrsF family protein [Bosea sp. LjRoot237]|uniref:NrsF family protein n=1 Tax=Bosea sp. LjRoot237 TaxID=3342292 RepID=UPI003ECF9880
MKTDELITLMAAGHQPVDTGQLRRATWLTTLVALAATAVLLVNTLGARPDLAQAIVTMPVIAKLLFGGSIAVVSLILFQQSLRPGLKPRRRLPAVAIPVALVVTWAAFTLAQAPTAQWGTLTFGRYWDSCLVYVFAYSMIPLLGLLLLARRGAPVDSTLTGASAGLASAGLATVAYALHCPDDAAPFLATWYTIAMVLVSGLAALVLPRFLRW